MMLVGGILPSSRLVPWEPGLAAPLPEGSPVLGARGNERHRPVRPCLRGRQRRRGRRGKEGAREPCLVKRMSWGAAEPLRCPEQQLRCHGQAAAGWGG